jgi:hypothetical protein
MAAVQTDRATMNRLAERDPQVYHPLDRLRGIIRKYVVIEGVLSAALFVSVWFTLGLILDYGLFKTAGWDWVRDGAPWVRWLALFVALGLFAAILVFRIARRVNKDFSYSALALVLERKFPKVLGDRLITAVEMADVEAMGRFGYSKDMIRATIAEARERVGKVPVNEVFNWRRLWVMGFLAVGLLFCTVAFSYGSYFIATGSASPVRFGWKFAHVTGIFAERNVALMNTPWPRRAHLEMMGIPESGEMTVGRDAPPPRITARAYRWVIADRNAPEGWRPLVWSDLNEELVGRRVPELPPSVLAVTSGGERSVDDVERWVYQTEGEVAPEVAAFRAKMREEMTAQGGYTHQELQEVFVALAAKADQPSMGRTLRRLDVPAEVTYRYSGKKTAGSGTLSPQQNNEFAGEIGGLKEDVDFVVRGADYESGTRRIRLIPPPSLRKLARDQHEPAYLHHAPPQNAGYDALENRLQKVAAKDLSLTGDRTVFVVPAGTQLTITGEAYVNDDKVVPETDRIVSAHVIPVAGRFPGTVFDDKAKPTQTPVPLQVAEDGSSFSITFKENKVANEAGEAVSLPKPRTGGIDFVSAATNSAVAAVRKHTDFRLTENVEFKVVYVNKFNVSTTRSFLIQVLQDQAPTVEVAFDVIRKVGNEYLVTPMARIPFNPDSFIKDDRGLSKVEVAYTYGPEDSDVVRSFRVKNALRPLLDVPLPGTTLAVPIALRHVDNFRALDRPDERVNGSVFLSAFLEQQKTFPLETRARFEDLLQIPRVEEAAPPAVKKVELKDANRDFFDLDVRHASGPKAGERVFDMLPKTDQVQQVFRMELIVQATDNNVDADAGPRVTKNAELIRLRVISESDLLIEIGREEEQLAGKLDEALVKLAAAKKKYDFVRSQYDTVASRYERLRPNEQPEDALKKEVSSQLDAIKVRALDALQDVEKARDIVQSVVREFRRITRECEVNRVNEAALTASRKFTDDLDKILRDAPEVQVSFPKTQSLMTGVQNGINIMSDSISERLRNPGDRTPLAVSVPSVAVSDAEISLHTLERELQRLRSEKGESVRLETLKRDLKKIKDDQALVRKDIIKWQIEIVDRETSPDPTIGKVGVVSLAKGETKKVQHTIAWNQYKEDDLKVKVTASDPSVVVPGEMNLNYEKHQFRFEYEIKAGTKEGDFVVTVTPAKGKPVQVLVSVK